MPSSISYSSMPPKFPDKQRRPGLIHLPQPLATPPRSTTRLPALNPAEKPSQAAQNAPNAIDKLSVQLRTPSPSHSSSRPRPQQSRRKQKRPSSAGVASNIADISHLDTSAQRPSSTFNSAAVTEAGVVKPSAVLLLSPPPTPASRASVKKNKSKPKGTAHARKPSKTLVLPVSPPLTPAVTEFKPAPIEEAVFSLESLLSAVHSAQDSSNESLPLAEDDEVIVWKQPQTPISLYPTPPPRAFSTPSRTPSPNELFNWEDLKNLPRLSPDTIAQLKEQYDIRPSEAFLHKPSQEPDLLMSLLQSSSSCPPSPGSATDVPVSFSAVSKPIPITRRVHGAHSRTPSVPTYPSLGHSSMMQYREDVADLFGLDVRDVMAVQRATEAWRAYAGSAFNNSPETERVPAPKFLGRLFS